MTESNYQIYNNTINYAIELNETIELNINRIPQNCDLHQIDPEHPQFIIITINGINTFNRGFMMICDPKYFEKTGFGYIQFLVNDYETNFIINNLNELFDAICFFQQMLDNLPNEPFINIPIEQISPHLQNHWIVRNNFL
jgi:hypothetical protein